MKNNNLHSDLPAPEQWRLWPGESRPTALFNISNVRGHLGPNTWKLFYPFAASDFSNPFSACGSVESLKGSRLLKTPYDIMVAFVNSVFPLSTRERFELVRINHLGNTDNVIVVFDDGVHKAEVVNTKLIEFDDLEVAIMSLVKMIEFFNNQQHEIEDRLEHKIINESSKTIIDSIVYDAEDRGMFNGIQSIDKKEIIESWRKIVDQKLVEPYNGSYNRKVDYTGKNR